jgi:hypothetical protein
MPRLTLRLNESGDRADLLELCDLLRQAGAVEVDLPVLGDPTPGYRGAEENIADVVATVTPAASMVGRILDVLRRWLARRPRRSIELTIGDANIKITGLSSTNEDRMVKAFVRHVSGGQ